MERHGKSAALNRISGQQSLTMPPALKARRERSILSPGSWWLALLLSAQSLLLAWSARVHSPVFDEPGYLVAGLSHWKYGRFDLYAANPPLLRTVATAPIHFFMHPKMDWTMYSRNPAHRTDLQLGRVFMQLNGKQAYDYFFVARATAIPVALIGTILCFLFAKEIFGGDLPGIVAAVFWAFSPEVLGHGSLITPDMCSTVTALAATYVLWRFLQTPTVAWAIVLGCVTSLAMLSRSFWLALPVIQLALVGLAWFVRSWKPVKRHTVQANSVGVDSESVNTSVPVSLPRAVGLVVGSSLLAVVLVDCFYGFQGTLLPLGQYSFVTWKLTGTAMPPMEHRNDMEWNEAVLRTFKESPAASEGKLVSRYQSRFPGEFVAIPDPLPGNRFAGTLLGKLPVPLPRRYMEGIDIQWRDIEYGLVRTDWASYFGGKWQRGGWWYFYLVGLLFKTPLTLLGAVVLGSVAILFRRVPFARTMGLACLLAPAIFILVILTASDGVHKHLRYAMPVLSFFAVTAGGATLWYPPRLDGVGKGHRLATVGLSLLLAAYVCGSLLTGPHWLSYFNRLAGGPENGEKWFLDCNVDWGQDLPFVADWLDKHPETQGSMKLAYWGAFSPADVGLIYDTPPPFARTVTARRLLGEDKIGPLPGWYIVSKNYVEGHPMPFRFPHSLQCYSYDQDAFGYFRAFKPVDRIGYSTLVYHLTANDVNPFREAMSLKPVIDHQDGYSVETTLQPPAYDSDVCPTRSRKTGSKTHTAETSQSLSGP